MARRSLTAEQALALLAATPFRIAELTAGLSEAQLHARPGPGEWSANEVLAHLRACADVRGASITTILADDRPAIRAIDPRTWMTRTDYLELEFQPSLRAFTAQRAELLAVLRRLPPDGWTRAATVTGAGKPLERTVLSFAEWLAIHERPHVKQIARVASVVRASQDT